MIGGGVTGATLARDLALRGVSVLLLEREDWGACASSGMLHDDPRVDDQGVARVACQEAGSLCKIARHLVHRCPVLLPVLPGDRRGVERLEAEIELYDEVQPLQQGRPHVRLSGEEARRVEPGLAPDVVAALTLDARSVDARRLAWANVLDAVRAGATARNHTAVEGLLRDGRTVIGVRCREPDGRRVEARARMVVNAAGPWAAGVAAMADAALPLRLVRSGYVVYDRRLTGFGIAAEAVDGREVALLPHGGTTLLGPAVADHYGDLDALEVLQDEVDYLLQAAGRVLPGLREHRPVRATAGVRPASFQWETPATSLPRSFVVRDHEREDGVPGLVSVAGGTLALSRLAAERAADVACRRLGARARCVTAGRPLPGAGSAVPQARGLAADHGIPVLAALRILGRHGSEAAEVLDDPRGGRLVCRCEAVTEAELAHAARSEQVRTLADAFRRVGLAAGPCAGTACLDRAAEVVGGELGWSFGQRREACRDYLTRAWRERAPVLDRWGWAQEELAYGRRRGWPGGL